MPKNYWMVVQTPENFRITRDMGFTVHGLKPKYRRRAERMEPGDLMLFYVSGSRQWTATASVKSKKYEDRTPIWQTRRGDDEFPYRVKIAPNIVLDEGEYIDAGDVGPRLDYLKRWPPERWYLAFFDSLHLLPQKDFRLIEGEMKRISSRHRRRDRYGRRPDPRSDAPQSSSQPPPEQPVPDAAVG